MFSFELIQKEADQWNITIMTLFFLLQVTIPVPRSLLLNATSRYAGPSLFQTNGQNTVKKLLSHIYMLCSALFQTNGRRTIMTLFYPLQVTKVMVRSTQISELCNFALLILCLCLLLIMSFSPSIFHHMDAGWYEYIYYFRFQLLFPSLFSVDRCRRSLLQKETGIYFTCSEILYLQWYENWLINYWLTCLETWTIWLTLNFRHLFCTLVSEKTRPFSFSCKLRIIKVTVVKKI